MGAQNYRAFFDEALRQIEEEFKQKGQENDFSMWIKRIEYVEDTPSSITVSVPSDFFWAYMMQHGYIAIIEERIKNLLGQEIPINHVASNKPIATAREPIASAREPIASAREPIASAREPIAAATKPSAPQEQATPAMQAEATAYSESAKPTDSAENGNDEREEPLRERLPVRKHPQLLEKYIFETFVPGDNSDFAYKASVAVANNPGQNDRYNPLILYGGVGLGKTHLMQSIGNRVYQREGDAVKICCISAENFTNEFTSSLAAQRIDKFKSKYRGLDLLLLDDIHFLINKKGIQEELFHTFDALRSKKAQMVFTCDRPIPELKGIEERLATRFNWGTAIDLQPPDYETRRAILQKKLDILDKHIPPEVVDYIAKNMQTNVRDLEQCLNKMLGYAELVQKPLTIDIAQKELRDSFSQPANGSLTVEIIQKVVANHYNVSLNDMKSIKRNKRVVVPRQIAIYIARSLLDISYPDLGYEFGGRDHTSIMHSYNKVADQIRMDSNFDAQVQALVKEIKDYKK